MDALYAAILWPGKPMWEDCEAMRGNAATSALTNHLIFDYNSEAISRTELNTSQAAHTSTML
jgi:hypothetical protein